MIWEEIVQKGRSFKRLVEFDAVQVSLRSSGKSAVGGTASNSLSKASSLPDHDAFSASVGMPLLREVPQSRQVGIWLGQMAMAFGQWHLAKPTFDTAAFIYHQEESRNVSVLVIVGWTRSAEDVIYLATNHQKNISKK